MSKFYLLIINLFLTSSLVKSNTTLSNDSVVFSDYYTKEEFSEIQKKILDLRQKKIWEQFFLNKINLTYNQDFRYIDKLEKENSVDITGLEYEKSLLPIKSKLEYRRKKQIKNIHLFSLDSHRLYYLNKNSCLKNGYFKNDASSFNLVCIVSYEYKTKIKKEDFLSYSFLSKLNIPKYKMGLWNTQFILENKLDKSIETSDLLYLYNENNEFYKVFLDAKDSLYIKRYFTIKKFPTSIILGLSKSNEIYVFTLTKQLKWVIQSLEEYVNNNPQIFK